MKHHTVC